MSRSVDEWVGQSDDTRVPPRVELRVFLAGGGRCAHCTVKLHRRKDWHLDHQIALINGGENRESNLQIVCTGCHKDKTRSDVAAKAKAARVRLRYVGIKGWNTPHSRIERQRLAPDDQWASLSGR